MIMYCFMCKKKIVRDERSCYIFVAEHKDSGDKTYFCPECVVGILAVTVGAILKDYHEILFRRF